MKKKVMIMGILIFIILSAIISTYAYFIVNINKKSDLQTSIESGTLNLIFEDGNNYINSKLNFGESVVKTFTIENDGSLDAIARISFDNLINTYMYKSLTYSLDYSTSEIGNYNNLVNNKNVPQATSESKFILANGLEIPAGEKYFYKLTLNLNYLSDIDQTEDLEAIFYSNFVLSEGSIQIPVDEQIKNLSENNSYCPPNFSVQSYYTDEKVCSMQDDYGESYYYRGSVGNNNVKFANLSWKIIRLNGDGTLRIIYYGAAGNLPYNYSKYDDPKYLGYMYGGANGAHSTSYKQAVTNETSTNAKNVVENWYKLNIEEKGYGNYVSDRIFCNDRSIVSGSGYGANSNTLYGAYQRIDVNKSPSFVCPQDNDKFTVDVENGNGALSYPVGLITADEVITAGAVYNASGGGGDSPGYLNYISAGYTMTPNTFVNSYPSLFILNTNLTQSAPHNHYKIVPVINLSIDTVDSLIGTGTENDPYRLE